MENKSSRYTDPTGELTTSQLRFSGWYLRHKILFFKIWVVFMIVFSTITIGYSFWKWGEYLFFGYNEDQQKLLIGQANEFQNYAAMQPAYKAQALDVSGVQTYQSGDNVYDLAANVTNKNERWIAHVNYHFTYSGGETEVLSTIILPGQKRPVIAFGQSSLSFPTGVRFIMDKVIWKNVSAHDVKDVAVFMKPRLDFVVENFVFNDVNPNGLNIASATFDLTNRTAYSYWQPIFYLELLNDNLVVGYVYFSTDKLLTIETRKMDLRYFGSSITVNNYRLITILNVFDPDVYMDPEK